MCLTILVSPVLSLFMWASCPITLVRMAVVKETNNQTNKKQTQILARVWGKRNLETLRVGLKTDAYITATVEISMRALQQTRKLNNYIVLSIRLRRLEGYTTDILICHAHCCTIHNSQCIGTSLNTHQQLNK